MKVLFLLMLLSVAFAQQCTEACQPQGGIRYRLAKRLKQAAVTHTICKEDTQQTICMPSSAVYLQRGYTCGPCQVTASCPDVRSSQTLSYTTGHELVLSLSSTDTLCTLRMVSSGGDVIPVTRSYLGHP